VGPELPDDRLAFGEDALWECHGPNHTLRSCDGNLEVLAGAGKWKNPEGVSAEASTLSGFSFSVCLSADQDTCRDRSLDWLDPSRPVGPDHWGPSPDFPCGAATAPCEAATLPDLRDPLRGPGAVVPVSRPNDQDQR
jgi:hypothetical protein